MFEIVPFLQELWPWLPLPLFIAAVLTAMTYLSFGLLNQTAKDEVALWLIGGHARAWSGRFTQLFDALFGANHLRRRCFLMSAGFSVAFVLLVWWVMGTEAMLGRFGEGMSWRALVVTALAVNVVVDFLSLMETRWVLGRLDRVPLALHPLVLVADALATGALIWGGLWLWQEFGGHTGQKAVLGEITGGFSVLSVFFYSTFLTSLWTWLYILSVAIMRAAMVLRLDRWSNVIEKPALWLSIFVFAATAGLAWPISLAFGTPEGSPITYADRALCQVFSGKTCERVAGLTEDEEEQLTYIMRACEGGVTQQCLDRAYAAYQIDNERAAVLWEKACDGGNAAGCFNLGLMLEVGIGVDRDLARAAELYRQACVGEDTSDCFGPGFLFRLDAGPGRTIPSQGAVMDSRRCNAGFAGSCTDLGFMYEHGFGVTWDTSLAEVHYSEGCNGGDAWGCAYQGRLYETGFGFFAADLSRARDLYQQACDMGRAEACDRAAKIVVPE